MDNSMLELISIHIPKTAGTSFEQTLKDVYGEKAVLRIDQRHRYRGTEHFFSFEGKEIPSYIKVIHGHFNYIQLKLYYDLPDNIPVITWLRDPIERSKSEYHYQKYILYEQLEQAQIGGKTYGQIKRLQMSHVQFAQVRAQVNLMSRFMEGTKLEQLYFIGIVEYYSLDLDYLADMLKWENYQEFRYNATDKQAITNKNRRIIKWHNLRDCSLYKQALYLRKKRLGSLKIKDRINHLINRSLIEGTFVFASRGKKLYTRAIEDAINITRYTKNKK